MSIDRYKEDLDRCKVSHKKLEGFFEERKQIEAQGKSTSGVDHKLKSEQFKLTKEVTTMEKLVYEYDNPNVTKYDKIDQGTKKKRIKELKPLIENWKRTIDQSKVLIEKKVMAQGGSKIDMNEELADFQSNTQYKAKRNEDGDYAHTQEMSSQQIMQHNKKQFDETDKQLDKISNIVGQLNYENQNFKDEVNMQNKMLDKVNDGIDKNISDMVKLDSKLKKLLAKSSICRLWCVIIIEIVILVALIVVVMQ